MTCLFSPVYTTPASRLAAKAHSASSSVSSHTVHHAQQDAPAIPTTAAKQQQTTLYESPVDINTLNDDPASKPTSEPVQSQLYFSKGHVSNPRSASMGHGVTSPVMNETLSVIEEHITDLHTPRESFRDDHSYSGMDDPLPTNRFSYIHGTETDEEDSASYTEAEVRKWNPEQVAEHLQELGAEQSQCEVFRDQEITGDVLLDLDRETILLKEFALGTLGRRLALFSKIQRLQQEVKGSGRRSRAGSQRSASLTSRSEATRDRLVAGAMLPKIPSLHEDSTLPSPYPHVVGLRHRAQSATGKHEGLYYGLQNSLSSRPSTASNTHVSHSRRHSSLDEHSEPITPNTPHTPHSINIHVGTPSHRKTDSLDRTWVMGNRVTAVDEPQPDKSRLAPDSSSSVASSVKGPLSPDFTSNLSTAVDLDRGYFSSNESESRKAKKNVLRKRDGSNPHVRIPSDGFGSRRLSGVFKHVRGASTDSISETPSRGNESYESLKDKFVGAASRFGGMQGSPSIDAIANSPTVGGATSHNPSPTLRHAVQATGKRSSGIRAISDAVTNREKHRLSKDLNIAAVPDAGSPSRTDSSNQSVTSTNKSVSFDDKQGSTGQLLPHSKYAPLATNIVPSPRRKVKQQTSAYMRGLEKKSPLEQIAGSDYSGWMRKKSKKLGKWHSRLFVLRGTRLSYYYSENDMEERGLIDIAFHRVLPANDDLIAGFHASLTGAHTGSISPEGASLQTAADLDAKAQGVEANSGGIFIFKLVPPRPGLSKAVNFTQPKVHFFAVSSIHEGRKWMAALMKATIERDDIKLLRSTYREKTISLNRAKELRVRPKEFSGEANAEADMDALGIKQNGSQGASHEGSGLVGSDTPVSKDLAGVQI